MHLAIPIRANPRRICTYATLAKSHTATPLDSAHAQPPRICTFHSYLKSFSFCTYIPFSPNSFGFCTYKKGGRVSVRLFMHSPASQSSPMYERRSRIAFFASRSYRDHRDSLRHVPSPPCTGWCGDGTWSLSFSPLWIPRLSLSYICASLAFVRRSQSFPAFPGPARWAPLRTLRLPSGSVPGSPPPA